jgi:hypothetical protein
MFSFQLKWGYWYLFAMKNRWIIPRNFHTISIEACFMNLSVKLIFLCFDLHLLGSECYVKAKLEGLLPVQLVLIRKAFVKNSHPRFKKEFASSQHEPFGKTSDYINGIKNADFAKLTRLIKIVGMLLQTKVYLFWKENLC